MKAKSNIHQDIHNIQEFTRGDLEALKFGQQGIAPDGDTIRARLKIIASAKRGLKSQDNQINKLKELLYLALGHIEGFEGQDKGETQKHIRRELKKLN